MLYNVKKAKHYKFKSLVWQEKLRMKGRGFCMNVLDLLEKRAEYPLIPRETDLWVSELAMSNDENVSIITTENAFRVTKRNENYLNSFFEKYNLKAMFDLQNPFANTGVKMFLYVFTKCNCSKIKYGIYKHRIRTKSKRSNKSGTFLLPDEYPETYFKFFDNVEKFVNGNTCPNDTDYQEFGYIKAELRNKSDWNPGKYNKRTLNVKKALKKEKTLLLSEIASIISPKRVGGEKLPNSCLSPSNWTYPIDYSKLKDGENTNCPLQKGDILFINKDRIFLVYETPQKEIYANRMTYIIRPNNVSSEYLYLYLKSETMQIIFQSMQKGCVLPRISIQDIKNIPVVLPKDSIENYEKLFYAQSFPPKTMDDFDEMLSRLTVPDESTIEGILNTELFDNLRLYKSDILERFLKEDIEELKICFKHKAYKATLILAGSILEAVLIDWLSELKETNYFKETFINSKGYNASLIDYIKEIEVIKKPKWYDEAEKANNIRKNRNLVHAKLCIKENTKIDESLCRDVIQYLIDVIKSRSGKKQVAKN